MGKKKSEKVQKDISALNEIYLKKTTSSCAKLKLNRSIAKKPKKVATKLKKVLIIF